MTTGKSKADFPGGFLPFDTTVGPVPTVSIDSPPNVQFCVNETWLPYLVTCLKALSRPETWNDTYDNAVIAASEFAALIASINDGCGVTVPSKMCLSASFEDADYGFEPSNPTDCPAVYVAGTGWTHCVDSGGHGLCDIKREFGTDTIIQEVHVTIDVVVPYLVNYDVVLYHSGTFTSVASASAVTGPVIQVDVTGLTEVASTLFIHVEDTVVGDSADIQIKAFGLCYTGAFPLSVNDAWERVYDFTIDDQGWTNDGFFGAYSAGVGWVDTTIYVSGEGNTYQGCGIKLTVGHSINVEFFEVDYVNTLGSNTVGGEGRHAFEYHTSGAPGNRLAENVAVGGSLVMTYSGLPVTDTVFGFDNTDAYLAGNVTGDGATLITRIVLRGHGTPP